MKKVWVSYDILFIYLGYCFFAIRNKSNPQLT